MGGIVQRLTIAMRTGEQCHPTHPVVLKRQLFCTAQLDNSRIRKNSSYFLQGKAVIASLRRRNPS